MIEKMDPRNALREPDRKIVAKMSSAVIQRSLRALPRYWSGVASTMGSTVAPRMPPTFAL